MPFTASELAAFWSAAWTVPFRLACRWLTPEERARVSPDAQPPRQIAPLCVQRWVGQAVQARLAWMRDHPEAAAYRYSGPYDESDPSIPCWTDKADALYDRRALHKAAEDDLLWRWNVEVERLLRVSEAPPCFVGKEAWARAALGISARLSQLYVELKRRQRAMRARAMLREQLRASICWDYRAAA
jgi:hypothetical protein